MSENVEEQVQDLKSRSGFVAFVEAWHDYDGPANDETREAFWAGWIAARKHDGRLVADIFGLEAR